ncbi:MAG: hypothetical protein HY548_04275 [Elusimicrobia bacterium]|nr:hypothetical protein [Elusimicrobiota bacterium]
MSFRLKKKFKKSAEKDPASPGGHGNGFGGWEQGVKTLCEDISHSFEDRQARLKDLREGTTTQLQEFRKEFKEQAQLRAKEFKVFFQDLKNQQEERSEEVAAFLGNVRKELAGFRSQFQQASDHWQHMCQSLAKKRAAH